MQAPPRFLDNFYLRSLRKYTLRYALFAANHYGAGEPRCLKTFEGFIGRCCKLLSVLPNARLFTESSFLLGTPGKFIRLLLGLSDCISCAHCSILVSSIHKSQLFFAGYDSTVLVKAHFFRVFSISSYKPLYLRAC